MNLQLAPDGEYGLVIYSDGGEDKSSGACGWGLHGYLYSVLEEKKDRFKKDKAAFGQYSYVNGTKVSQTFKAGKRIVEKGPLFKVTVNEPKSVPGNEPVTPEYFFDFYESVPGENSTVAEILAMTEALRLVGSIPGISQAVIIADSEYVCKGITEYMPQWLKRGGRKSNNEPVKHWDKWLIINDMVMAYSKSGIVLRIGWTASHVGEPGNELADSNATRGKIAVLNNLEGARHVINAKNYSQKKKLNNRLLEHRWWYSINDQKSDSYEEFPGKNVYFFGNHGKAETEDDLIGKYTSTAKIAILVTSEPEPVLEKLHDYLYHRFYDGVGLVTLGYLEHITNTERYAMLSREGESVLYPKGNNGAIYTPDDTPVLKELRPTFHGLRLIQNLNKHLELLAKFVDGDNAITVTDITDVVFTREQVGNKKPVVKPAECINPPHKTVSIEVGYNCMGKTGKKKIPFKMGQDIPLRNTLNAIADEGVSVYAITWQRSKNEFRYGTVVKAGEDILLTCSLAANLVALTGLK